MLISTILLTLGPSHIGAIIAGAVCGAAFVILGKRISKRRNG